MSTEEILNELRKYAEEFENLGDANTAIKNNKEDFLAKWAKLNQYYNYALKNIKTMSDEWFTAIDIVDDISYRNPSLSEWIDKIISQSNDKEDNETNNIDNLETMQSFRSM